MPRYKHISKKANRRRRKQFESSFSFRLSRAYHGAVWGFARLGERMNEVMKKITPLMSNTMRPFFFGVDPAAPNGDHTATVIIEQDGDISKVVGVVTLDKPDREGTIITSEAIRGLVISEPRRAGKTTRAKALQDKTESDHE